MFGPLKPFLKYQVAGIPLMGFMIMTDSKCLEESKRQMISPKV